jgi:ADP-ribosylglycohydrolase
MTKIIVANDYMERVYAGWLGKIIGVRHGGNIENWSFERIERTFGEIKDYLHTFKHFAADDDTNGPIFFLRALEDYTYTSDISAEQMGLTLLNYAPDGHGFFWWGGYGRSTEHTAYLNLKNGIMAPASGSIEMNGTTVAEQIGGQIFCDIWGLIAPGRPHLAAEYAGKMASVSHDGNGKYGAMFIAACIAAAFEEQDLLTIIEVGLSVIPVGSEYTRMTRDIIRFHQSNPTDWRTCLKFVFENYGYDRYAGTCHIIPNSAVIILSLLYGEGDFSKAINICNMCGWDTDCNVANVGTIMGVRNGLEGISPSWRQPINDFLCCSSVIGTLNILDIPSTVAYIAKFGYLIAGQSFPDQWASILKEEAARFHFELPGSTHGFKTESDMEWSITSVIANSQDFAATGQRSLKVLYDDAQDGYGYRAFYKTYYVPEDFNDSRYDPSFSPLLYPGQTVSAKVYMPQRASVARLFVKDIYQNLRHYGEKFNILNGEWTSLQMAIPYMENACLGEVGIEVIPNGGNRTDESLIFYLDDFDFGGQPHYALQFKHGRTEHWNGLHKEISQFTNLRGLWALENGELSGSYYGESAECYTGDLQWRDYHYEASVIPRIGEHHNILFRVQGAIRSYAVGLAPNQTIQLLKNDHGYRELASAKCEWELNQSYSIAIEAKGNHFVISVDGKVLLETDDIENPYLFGQIGFCNSHGSRTHYGEFSLKGIS